MAVGFYRNEVKIAFKKIIHSVNRTGFMEYVKRIQEKYASQTPITAKPRAQSLFGARKNRGSSQMDSEHPVQRNVHSRVHQFAIGRPVRQPSAPAVPPRAASDPSRRSAGEKPARGAAELRGTGEPPDFGVWRGHIRRSSRGILNGRGLWAGC